MSVDIHVDFYLNGEKRVSGAYLNNMKALLDGWNWMHELIPVSNDKVVDPGEKEQTRGNWFNSDSFINAANKLKTEREKYQNKLMSLKLLKNSIEYYKLNYEQTERLDSDIDFNSDMLEELNTKIYVCQYMSDTLEMIADMYGSSYDDYCIIYSCLR